MEDLIIIGAGPAGLTAGLYASRARLKTVLLEKLAWFENRGKRGRSPGIDAGEKDGLYG